jgi:hypothetical protein
MYFGSWVALLPQQPAPDLVVRIRAIHDRQDLVRGPQQPDHLSQVHRPITPSGQPVELVPTTLPGLKYAPGGVAGHRGTGNWSPPATVSLRSLVKGSLGKSFAFFPKSSRRRECPGAACPSGALVHPPGVGETLPVAVKGWGRLGRVKPRVEMGLFGSGKLGVVARVSHSQVESRMGAVAWGLWPAPRFPSHRVTGGGRPPPVPTERGVRLYRTTLFGSWFTALQAPAASRKGGAV